MELIKSGNLATQFEGFTRLPAVRQLGLMFGLAASVALGVAVVLWSQEPNYDVLFGGLAQKDASQVVETLQAKGIEYQVDRATGAIMVPSNRTHEVRMELAKEGLPKSSGMTLEILKEKQEFGTSQFIQSARYQHALEGELGKSVSSINAVESARVHLALPEDSVFVRKRKQPSASVVVNLYPGRVMGAAQVEAVQHMVASAIANLEPQSVTVVDQKGDLLSKKAGTAEMARNDEQFKYTRRLEDEFIGRIENILGPIVGSDGVRAQVTADMDFTVTEKTRESYNPDLPALRSEQVTEEKTSQPGAEGVPGALTNQPPGQAAAPEQAAGEAGQGQGGDQTLRSRKTKTANYELDKTISHTRLETGVVNRLSVAVVVDDKVSVNDEGETVREPRTDEEIQRITSLVKEAIGYNAQRGDTVNVINAAFTERGQPATEVAEAPLWEQPWVWDLGKQALGVLAVLLLIFAVLRPMLRNLATVPAEEPATAAGEGEGEGGAQPALSGPQATMQLPQPDAYEANVDLARQMAMEDPKHVAQVVRTWIASDD